MQTDGSISLYHNKKPREWDVWRISLVVSRKSLPMLKRTVKIFTDIFHRKVTIFHNSRGYYGFQTSINTLLPFFEQLDVSFRGPPSPPSWIVGGKRLFGAYLAGVIDGDGHIKLKRPEYPQCEISISSEEPQYNLKTAIEGKLKCTVRINRVEKSSRQSGWYLLSFYVSKKNILYIRKYVLPMIEIHSKRERLKSFIIQNQK
ncbi:MAG: hypothetical protein J7K68_02325 [Candidatus Diapherotrites archaeon]|nr:hypothetical protein [Candidatus Diapherotrites archaeon]